MVCDGHAYCHLTYTGDELLSYKPKSVQLLNPLPVTTVNHIRSLGIKRRFRGRRGRGLLRHVQRTDRYKSDHRKGANLSNLATLKKDEFRQVSSSSIKIGFVNPTSLRNKTCEYLFHITESDYDVCFVNETWIQPHDLNVLAKLKTGEYDFIGNPPPTGRPGDGLGISFKRSLKVLLKETQYVSSFESANDTLYLVTAY